MRLRQLISLLRIDWGDHKPCGSQNLLGAGVVSRPSQYKFISHLFGKNYMTIERS
jgi:hypothetical protein